MPQSAENLERSAWHAPSRTFYTAIPVSSADKSKGLLAQTDPNSGTIIKLHELERCHPHSLSIVSDTTIFLGCSLAHGPNRKPGGDMAVFDIASGKIESYGAGWGGNGGSTVNLARAQYYHATTNGALVVVDTKTRQLVQKVPTWNGCAIARRQSRDQQDLRRHQRQGRPLRRLRRGVRAGVSPLQESPVAAGPRSAQRVGM